MHILIKDKAGKHYAIKKADIRRVYEMSTGKTVVCFTGTKNTPINVPETVEDFHNIYLAKQERG